MRTLYEKIPHTTLASPSRTFPAPMKITSRIVKHEDVRWRELHWLQPDDFKEISKQQFQSLKNSLKANGFIQALNISANKERWVLDGVHRLRAMKELEEEGCKIPDKLPANFIRVKDQTDAEKLVIVYSAIYARATPRTLHQFLTHSDINFDLLKLEIDLPGINLAKFETEWMKEAPVEEEATAPSSKPATRGGDLYELGRHRLLCGDATSKRDVGRLMAGSKAHLVFTDPPYGVSYQDDAIRADDLRDDGLVRLLIGSLRNAIDVTTSEAAFYIWHASATRKDFEFAMGQVGLSEKQMIIWIKESFVLGHADYHWQMEPCFYASKSGEKPQWFGDRTESTVWRLERQRGTDGLHVDVRNGVRISDGEGSEIIIQRKSSTKKLQRLFRLKKDETLLIDIAPPPGSDTWQIARTEKSAYVHPTQKPTELAKRAIRNSTAEDQAVLDLFVGSGSTLIAADELNRSCYALELDPKFCDVVVRRYADHCRQQDKRPVITRNGKDDASKWLKRK